MGIIIREEKVLLYVSIATIILFLVKNHHFKIDILFYDGNHTYKDQYQMVTKFKDILSDIFILIVDDWNWERDGILHAIEDLNFKILYDKQIYTNGEDPNDFWNGLGIFLLER